MQIVLISLLIIALVAGLVSVVMLPKPWQRAVVLILVGIPIFLIAHSVIVIGQNGVAVWNYGSNIRPASELWSIVRCDVDAGQYEQAKARLALITSKWSKIGTQTYSYSAGDLLREIEAAHKNSEQGGGGNAPAPPSHPPNAPPKARATP
jgi:hypothetical protein